MKNNQKHIEMRNKVKTLINLGFSIEEIASKLNLPVGTRFVKKSAKWYRYCIVAKKNQKKAIEKHPNLYSKAGKIAQQKHPWIGHELGKKYGPIQGKLNRERLKGNSKYFSKMAIRLQEINPEHSRNNMRKAHETMKKKGTFNKHQREAVMKCIEKNPNQLKEMSKKAHKLDPDLALRGIRSGRKNRPYLLMNCRFDSNEEREFCQLLLKLGYMKKPIEGKNVHIKIKECEIDFLIKEKYFIEYHPPLKYGNRKGETLKSYYERRREHLDKNGYGDYPLMVFDRCKNNEIKLKKFFSNHSPSNDNKEKTL